MPDVTMPRLSDSMEEGTILKWLKSEGDDISKGEELVEIETDKATMTYEADADGTLEIVADEGAALAIGEVIARIGEGGGQSSEGGGEAEKGASAEGDGDSSDGGGTATKTEDEDAEPEDAEPEDEGGDDEADEAAQEEKEPQPEPAAQGDGDGDGAARDGGDDGGGRGARARAERAPSPEGTGGRAKASPVARRIAREHGIDLSTLEGTGPGGRIVKADVEAAASKGGDGAEEPEAGKAETVAAEAEAEAEAPEAREAQEPEAEEAADEREEAPEREPEKAPAGEKGKGEVTVEEPSRIQQIIARRMAESKATIPHFTLSMDVDMEGAVELREQLKGLAEHQGTPVPSYNDMVVKACAIALRDFPLVNGSYKDGGFELHSRINIGVAVAGEGTLIVPTIFDADRKGLGEIASESRALAEKVRDGKISPPELSGATFSITNLGMYGVTTFTAVINPPQAAILAVGKMEQKPVVRDGEVVARHGMNVTIACDHRILSGAPAAEFLARVKAILEQPVALAL